MGKRIEDRSQKRTAVVRNISKGVLFVAKSIDLPALRQRKNSNWNASETYRGSSRKKWPLCWVDTAYGLIQSNLAILAGVIVLMA
jgi:hypothetical protein